MPSKMPTWLKGSRGRPCTVQRTQILSSSFCQMRFTSTNSCLKKRLPWKRKDQKMVLYFFIP